MNKNNTAAWGRGRFLAIPILAIAAHFLLFNLLYLLFEGLFLGVLQLPAAQIAKFSYLTELLIYVILILLFYVFYRLLFGQEDTKERTVPELRDSVLSFLAGIGVSGVSLLWIMLAEQIPALQKSIAAMNAGNERLDGGRLLVEILTAVIAAPFIEELLFRGIVFRSLRKIAPVGISILLSSVLFGIYHMNAVQAVYASCMGAVAAILYEKRQNLLFPILVHIANNLIAAMLDFTPPETGERLRLLSFAMLIPLGCILRYFLRGERRKRQGGQETESVPA